MDTEVDGMAPVLFHLEVGGPRFEPLAVAHCLTKDKTAIAEESRIIMTDTEYGTGDANHITAFLLCPINSMKVTHSWTLK